MSTPNVRRRPSLWSYFSFSSTHPRRTSVSLPTRNPVADPHEKADRHTNGSANGSASLSKNGRNALMTPGQRWRYVKVGGLIGFVVLVLLVLARTDDRVVRYVGRESRLGCRVGL